MIDHIEQFAAAMRAAGIEVVPAPGDIIADGRIHRFSSNGKRGNTSGWYILFPDDVPAGRFGCWRDGIDVDGGLKMYRCWRRGVPGEVVS